MLAYLLKPKNIALFVFVVFVSIAFFISFDVKSDLSEIAVQRENGF